MVDWYVLLTPLLLVPIGLLFVFVGCTGEDPDTTPQQPPPVVNNYIVNPPPQVPPAEPPPQGQQQPPPSIRPTRFQLNFAPSLQQIPAGTDAKKVTKVTVTWLYRDTKNPSLDWRETRDVVPKAPPFIDPATDSPDVHDIPTAQINPRDVVFCSCVVSLRLDDPNAPPGPDEEIPVPAPAGTFGSPLLLVGEAVHVFELGCWPAKPGETMRQFYVIPEKANE